MLIACFWSTVSLIILLRIWTWQRLPHWSLLCHTFSAGSQNWLVMLEGKFPFYHHMCDDFPLYQLQFLLLVYMAILEFLLQRQVSRPFKTCPKCSVMWKPWSRRHLFWRNKWFLSKRTLKNLSRTLRSQCRYLAFVFDVGSSLQQMFSLTGDLELRTLPGSQAALSSQPN